MGWDGVGVGGREVQEGGDMSILTADSLCRIAETNHCKMIILQLEIKINFILKKGIERTHFG